MRSRSRRLLLSAGLTLVAAAVIVPAAPVSAHPLGNFTVNTYAGLSVQPDRVKIDYVVDMAEIPTYQARSGIDADGDGRISEEEGRSWAATKCEDAVEDAQVKVDGEVARLTVDTAAVVFPPGNAGLDTLRLTCELAAPADGADRGVYDVEWRSTAYTDRVGWREVTAVGSGTTLVDSDVAATSVSARLTQYPNDLLSSPLDQRAAHLRVRADGGTGSQAANATQRPAGGADPGAPRALPGGVDAFARSFTTLVARQDLTLAFGALAVVLAVGLGAIHALAPGHGKTVMAAYLVGQRGSLREAGVIALTVTATHTVGVLVLGLVLSASTTLAPEAVYPWLGLVSGAMLAAVGLGLLRRSLRGRGGHSHGGHSHGGQSHSHSGDHGHGHSHDLTHDHGPLPADAPVSRRTLVAMGVAGGMVPSPSALVVLLGALALGRAWFGVLLVVGYGAGMALTLTAAGLVLVRARRLLDRRPAKTSSRPSRVARLARAMPALTASLIVVVGVFLAAQGAVQI